MMRGLSRVLVVCALGAGVLGLVPIAAGADEVPTLCQPGFFSNDGFAPCSPAPPGTFVGSQGATSASPCPAETATATVGSAACTPCPAGSTTNGAIGRVECQTVTPDLPTTTQDCKQGGWLSYEIFRNQGDCVSFVAAGGRNLAANG